MKPLLLAVAASAAFAAFAAPARALSPEAAAFVRNAGLDPASEAVRVADADGTITTTYRGDTKKFSLESLSAEGARNGVLAFVTTRAFIHKLEANFSTPIPKAYYDGLYLTAEQRRLVARKIVES